MAKRSRIKCSRCVSLKMSQIEEWRGRASRFQSLCEDIAQLHCSVVGGANRAVLYDLYPYVWDLRNMALVAKAFICWLGEYQHRLRWLDGVVYNSFGPI